MNPAQRDALLDQVGRDRIVWAGLVGEMEGKFAVNMFTTDGAARQSTVQAGGVDVVLSCDNIENCAWVATQGKFEGLLTMPGVEGTLAGPEAATVLARRLNEQIQDVTALRAAIVNYARMCGAHVQRMGNNPVIVTALRTRALAAYVMQTPRLPTQAEFTQFVAERNEPWALALRAPRHNRGMVSAETLQLHLIPEIASRGMPFGATPNLVGWVRPGLPLMGTQPLVAQAQNQDAPNRPLATIQHERPAIRLEDLPPVEMDYVSITARHVLPLAPGDNRKGVSKEIRESFRNLYPTLGA